ncbi:MAG: bifunctional oligoribonuclease/PAP phosphatase NrnA [Melioribacteraceae bacterium]|nr:bifunctional oligoribonuclease/PAP phosphatase NrnA [Melioribacteraceae bacterium]
MNNFLQLKEIILNHNSFIISSHVNPDADAIGSELAFYYLLKKLNKNVRIINHSKTPYNLEFLDSENIIERYDEETHSNIFNEAEVFLLLDLNQAYRIVKMENGLRNFKGIKICIDHHQDPENIFDLIVGNTDYAATGEIIYDFIKQTNIVELDKNISLQLYAAIMTDTGSFRFERTSSKIHLLIAELLEYGINPKDIYDKIYDQFMFGRIKLLGRALSSIQLDETNKIAYMIVTQKMLEETNTCEDDVDGFVGYCLSIQNVTIGILFYELKDGLKISFRSKGNIPVNLLAKDFGGGGHINASGTRLFNISIDEILDKVILKAQQYLRMELK